MLITVSINIYLVIKSLIFAVSNCVEIATGRYKAQEHFPPIDINVSQPERDTLQHFSFSITAYSKSVSSAIIKVVQDRLLSPVIQGIAPSY